MLLERVARGDEVATEALLPIVYDDLRAMAGSQFRAQPVAHTLQPTALVHEAYLRMVQSNSDAPRNKSHFMAVAATAMRQILHDRARRKGAQKRGGPDAKREPLETIAEPSTSSTVDLIALDDALTQLTELAPRQARIVELRYFGGLTIDEAARVLDVSHGTVESDWRVARAWLRRALKDHSQI